MANETRKWTVTEIRRRTSPEYRRARQISDLIEGYIKRRGVTGRQLAAATGLNTGYISQLRHGRNRPNSSGESTPVNPSLSDLVALAHAMQMSTPDLVAFVTGEQVGVSPEPEQLTDEAERIGWQWQHSDLRTRAIVRLALKDGTLHGVAIDMLDELGVDTGGTNKTDVENE